MVELLSPVGDFECLKSAVQNGANSVYFGSNIFSARAFAKNFDLNNLQKAIQYAKLRGVKTHLTLNTLIKDSEYDDAIYLAIKAYEFGIDAIIVQDLGLALDLIRTFPDLPIHASTQITVHNLNGALELESLGFKRVVLARELSINEIEYICKNTNIEIETFIHGALCISYSGQCLFSSMLGGRSGNRGKCAGPCRLPFELLENDKKIDSGYLLNTKDLCGLDYIPSLIKAGVKCFKIEGRMKNPEYVAVVTRIYRKYIDLALSNKKFVVDNKDRLELLQVFNRGMSSSGHLDSEPNHNLVYKENPSNLGIFLGVVQKYKPRKGYIDIKLKQNIEIGDTISIENKEGSYTISELMSDGKNITSTKINQLVTLGRIKGKINPGDKVFKMSSKKLNSLAKESIKKENIKIGLKCNITIKKNSPISINITSANNLDIYKNLDINYTIDYIPCIAKNKPLDKLTVINQISKTNSTPFEFKNINVDLDDNLFLPKISILNELRRNALDEVEKFAISNIVRNPIEKDYVSTSNTDKTLNNMRNLAKSASINSNNYKISLLLNILDEKLNYTNLQSIDNIYIPLKYFTQKKYEPILTILSQKADLYVYMPTIVKGNYKNLFYSNIKSAIKKYDIQGFVMSNICNIKLLNDLFKDVNKYFKLITNYTFNVFNTHSILELKKLGISQFTISPEADKNMISNLCAYNYLQKELIVYGKTPLLNMNYCLLGETDKCYPTCKQRCISNNIYHLKDRLNMKFRIIPDNIQTVTTVYNSKITSISPKAFNIDFARIDILEENIDEINIIIGIVKRGNRLEGSNFTSGNLNREI